jgi:polygalacturonase
MAKPFNYFLIVLAGFIGIHALSVAAQIPPEPVIPSAVWDISKYGAVGDGTTLNTEAVQKAIDACSGSGGGTVLVPAGKFLIGPITLASHINLKIDAGAILLISDDLANYPTVENKKYQNAISVSDAHDIKISGGGTIDGQGFKWWEAFRANRKMPSRPNLIRFSRVTRLEVSGVTLQNSPGFHLDLIDGTDVTIRDVTIRAPADSPNTDGMDPSGWNYLITKCTIDVGDDNIAIKPLGARTPVNKNFTITQCRFLHGHGMSIGSSTKGGIEDVAVSDCAFDSTDSGIRIKTSRGFGGLLQHVTYSDLRMTNVKHPIDIADYYPIKTAPKHPSMEREEPVTALTPINRDITIRNVTATDCPTAGTIYGLPEAPITDITFDHVNISAKTGMIINQARNVRFISSKITVEEGKPIIPYNAQITGSE